MCSENEETDELMVEFQETAKQLDAVLDDIKWRKPDVEREEALLKELQAAASKDPKVDAASQAIVVRVARAILDDKIAEADRLEKRMKELQAKIERAQGVAVVEAEKTTGPTVDMSTVTTEPPPKKKKAEKRGQAVQKEEK